jgi:starch synthase
VKVLFASVEVAPFAWTGGMGDVAGSLPKALRELGVDIRVIMPKHRGAAARAGDVWRVLDYCPVHMPWWVTGCSIDETRLPGTDVPVYMVEHNQYFDREGVYGPPGGSFGDNLERFTFFCRAVAECHTGLRWEPDVVHLNDWHTSLLALYQKQWGLSFRTAYTAHQLGPAYHGRFPADQQLLAGIDLGRPEARRFVLNGEVDLARAGLALADVANTVSPQYAREVAQDGTEEGVSDLVGEMGDRFAGILNGIDYSVWNPAIDRSIPAMFTREDVAGKAACKRALQEELGLPTDEGVPLVVMVSRLDAIKGFDLVLEVLPRIQGAQFVFLGSGDPRYQTALEYAAHSRPDVRALCYFDPDLSHRVYAAGDMLLMPSWREPAGLTQMIAVAYGTIPVVHLTGGLADTIHEGGEGANGFTFVDYTAGEFEAALRRALAAYQDREAWQRLVHTAMGCDFSWRNSAAQYLRMYERALAR